MKRSYRSQQAKLAQGQVLGTPLAVVREVDRNAETLTYTIGLFKIMATRRGITFSGSSVTFNPETASKDLLLFVHYAIMSSQQMAGGYGLPLQRELERDLKLKTKEKPGGGVEAWFQGHKSSAVIGESAVDAVKKLRDYHRVVEHGSVTSNMQK